MSTLCTTTRSLFRPSGGRFSIFFVYSTTVCACCHIKDKRFTIKLLLLSKSHRGTQKRQVRNFSEGLTWKVCRVCVTPHCVVLSPSKDISSAAMETVYDIVVWMPNGHEKESSSFFSLLSDSNNRTSKNIPTLAFWYECLLTDSQKFYCSSAASVWLLTFLKLLYDRLPRLLHKISS